MAILNIIIKLNTSLFIIKIMNTYEKEIRDMNNQYDEKIKI